MFFKISITLRELFTKWGSTSEKPPNLQLELLTSFWRCIITHHHLIIRQTWCKGWSTIILNSWSYGQNFLIGKLKSKPAFCETLPRILTLPTPNASVCAAQPATTGKNSVYIGLLFTNNPACIIHIKVFLQLYRCHL